MEQQLPVEPDELGSEAVRKVHHSERFPSVVEARGGQVTNSKRTTRSDDQKKEAESAANVESLVVVVGVVGVVSDLGAEIIGTGVVEAEVLQQSYADVLL